MNLRSLILISILTICLSSVDAQQIIFDQDSSYLAVEIGTRDAVIKNNVTNRIPQQREFSWKRSVLEITTGWESAVCDVNLCYGRDTGEATFEIGPNSTGALDVHAYPDDIFPGSAVIEIEIQDVIDTTINNFAYFFFNSEMSSSQDVERLDITLYPNPSNGLLYIKDTDRAVDNLVVTNTLGQDLLAIKLGQGELINLSQLNKGIYWMQLRDKQGLLLDTKQITIQ